MDETAESRRAGLPSRMETSTTESQKPGLELLIGSNIFRNTNGVVKIHGKEQLVLECKPEQGLLLLTLDLYSEGGARIAHLRRNGLALNQTGQFTIDLHQATPDRPDDTPWVRLSDQQSGEIVLEARVASENKIQISSAKFFSPKGILVEVTPHYCRIGSGVTRFGDIVENRGGMVVLD